MPKRSPALEWANIGVGVAFNFAATILIGYLFILVVMTAAAQQRVIAVLETVNAGRPEAELLDFSTALATVNDTKNLKAVIADSSSALPSAQAEARRADEARDEQRRRLDEAWNVFLNRAPLAIASSPSCDKELTAQDVSARQERWIAVRACVDYAAMTRTNRARVEPILDGPESFGVAYRNWYAANSEARRAEETVRTLQDRLKADNLTLTNAAPFMTAFDEMNVLTDGWLPGADLFVTIPPSMMQILMAFVSGLFGALLITMILVVYPNNKLSASASINTNVAARIILGGMISLGVYIVLGGGAAVLGDFNFDQSQTNYMTFCAVGVLAGMFSDRVASWLSDRVDAFFATDRSRDGPPSSGSDSAGSSDPAYG